MRNPFGARFRPAPIVKTGWALIGRAWTACQATGTRVRGSSHDDDRDQPPIVWLLAMRGAAIAEEAALVGVGVEAKILEASDPRARRALGDIGVEVEHRMARSAAGGEV